MKAYKLWWFFLPLWLTSCGDDPTPCFEYEVTDDYEYTVAFTNCSDLAVDYQWDFGDGSVSTEDNPTHSYDKPGTYKVVLTAVNGKREAMTNKEVEIAAPLKITGSAGASSTTYNKKITISAAANAKNGIAKVQIYHKYSDNKKLILDSIFKSAPTDANISINYWAPIVYRKESSFLFAIVDAEQMQADDKLTISSNDKIDTTAGEVLVQARDGVEDINFEFSYATGGYKPKTGMLEFEFYAKDGSYIKLSKGTVKTEVYTYFSIDAYNASTKTTYTKEVSRNTGSDELLVNYFDETNLQISGHVNFDVNIDDMNHDVLEVSFSDVNLCRIIE